MKERSGQDGTNLVIFDRHYRHCKTSSSLGWGTCTWDMFDPQVGLARDINAWLQESADVQAISCLWFRPAGRCHSMLSCILTRIRSDWSNLRNWRRPFGLFCCTVSICYPRSSAGDILCQDVIIVIQCPQKRLYRHFFALSVAQSMLVQSDFNSTFCLTHPQHKLLKDRDAHCHKEVRAVTPIKSQQVCATARKTQIFRAYRALWVCCLCCKCLVTASSENFNFEARSMFVCSSSKDSWYPVFTMSKLSLQYICSDIGRSLQVITCTKMRSDGDFLMTSYNHRW